MSLSLYEAALREPACDVRIRHADGRLDALDVGRWSGPLDEADRRLLRGLTGPVLDIGCGPGRFGAELAARGTSALGIDVSMAAVLQARARGGRALRRDVFTALPGGWHDILLIDGNIGIGGDPGRLLTRVRELLAPDGRAHVELGPPGLVTRRGSVRLERDLGAVGAWFPWSWIGVDGIAAVAEPIGLSLADTWDRGGRWFATLTA